MGAAVLIPATSANLGPGFDSFGLALDLHNRFEAELADEWSVAIEGEGAGALRTDGGNRVATAMALAFEALGTPELRARIGCVNRIPLGNGLGSSSVGDRRRRACSPRSSRAQSLGEQAPSRARGRDRGASRQRRRGASRRLHRLLERRRARARRARFQPARGLAVVVVVANEELSTKTARAMLPEAVPHADAAFNVAHAGLLAASIATGRPELLGAALADRLHEPYRASAVADMQEVHAILRDAGAAGVALSGAGPTIIGLVAGDTDEAAHDLAEEVAERAADRVRALGTRRAPAALRIDRAGARVL